MSRVETGRQDRGRSSEGGPEVANLQAQIGNDKQLDWDPTKVEYKEVSKNMAGKYMGGSIWSVSYNVTFYYASSEKLCSILTRQVTLKGFVFRKINQSSSNQERLEKREIKFRKTNQRGCWWFSRHEMVREWDRGRTEEIFQRNMPVLYWFLFGFYFFVQILQPFTSAYITPSSFFLQKREATRNNNPTTADARIKYVGKKRFKNKIYLVLLRSQLSQ